VELSSWSLRQRGYHHRIPDAAPSYALRGVHTPIVVIRESGLTIIELELELEEKKKKERNINQANTLMQTNSKTKKCWRRKIVD